MISCTEFIPAYSELFKFLESKGGKKAVVAYWENLSDAFLGNLKEYVIDKGLAGCFEYWSHTLTEEAADFKMTLDEEKGTLELEMRDCPSRRRLLEMDYMEAYPDYCEHCDVLYRRVLEPLGFEMTLDMSRCDEAICNSIIRKKKKT